MNKQLKICFAASSGGHWEELMCLKKLTEQHQTFFVTEEGVQAKNSNLHPLYALPLINRHEKRFAIHFLQLLYKAFKILLKEKPDVVITTGALLSVPFCWIGKIRGAKIIYIESFARVYEQSLSGKLVYPIADLFLVQWESLLKVYPKATYVGCLF